MLSQLREIFTETPPSSTDETISPEIIKEFWEPRFAKFVRAAHSAAELLDPTSSSDHDSMPAVGSSSVGSAAITDAALVPDPVRNVDITTKKKRRTQPERMPLRAMGIELPKRKTQQEAQEGTHSHLLPGAPKGRTRGKRLRFDPLQQTPRKPSEYRKKLRLRGLDGLASV